MSIYFWKGNYDQDGSTFQAGSLYNISTQVAGNTAREKAVLWNEPSNWLIRREGSTFGSFGGSGSGYSGASTGDFHLELASTAPGGGDSVFFQRIANTNGITYSIPLSACLVGGYWNENSSVTGSTATGWIGAGNTSSRLSRLVIHPNYGHNIGVFGGINSYQDYSDDPAGIIGTRLWDRSYLASSYYRQLAKGTSSTDKYWGGVWVGQGEANAISGLRIYATSVNSKPSLPLMYTLVHSDVISGNYAGRYERDRLIGGTFEQLSYSTELAPVSAFGVGADKWAFIEPDGYAGGLGWAGQTSPNVTDFINVQGEWSHKVSNNAKFYYASRFTTPTAIVNCEIRPAEKFDWQGDFTNFYVYPARRTMNEYGSNVLDGKGHWPVVLGRGSCGGIGVDSGLTMTIGTLHIKDGFTADQLSFPNVDFTDTTQNPDLVFDGDDMIGANNIVSIDVLDRNFQIDNLNLEAGRLMIGKWLIQGSSALSPFIGYPHIGGGGTYDAQGVTGYKCVIGEDDKILIKAGKIYNGGILDARHHDPEVAYKGFKVGNASDHPRDGAGIAVKSEGAKFVFSDESRFVVDFKQAEAGVTLSIDPTQPFTIASRTKPSTNP